MMARLGVPASSNLQHASRAARLEAVAHQHLPIFHTEHCVYARFLSTGDSYLDCGRPCERAALHLRDERGRDHLVLADEGCRNTVFNAQAQSGARALPWHFLPPCMSGAPDVPA
jgi:hypothetical protein